MTIKARFNSPCKGCGRTMYKNERIEWSKGAGAYHPDCAPETSKQYGFVTTRFNSGATIYRNRRGRCEDAPCCGCCS